MMPEPGAPQPAPKRSMRLLVSSMSARGRGLRLGREVVDVLRAGGWEVEVKVTTQESDVEVDAAEYQGALLGAIGGDGYLTVAARGCMASGATLVPFPGGRGNDLCRSLGIGPDPVKWAWRLAEASTEQVRSWVGPLDAMEIVSTEGRQRVLGILSLGIDATAASTANQSWLRSGPLAYAWGATAGYLGKFKPLHVKGFLEGRVDPGQLDPSQAEGDAGPESLPLDLHAWLCSVSNTGWFGGGVNILPQSRTDDGLLEVVSVSGIGRLRVLPKLAKVLLLRQIDDPVISVETATRVVLEEPAGLMTMADGDDVATLPLSISVVPAALTVVRPGDVSVDASAVDTGSADATAVDVGKVEGK